MATTGKRETAVLGGGCFWCLEAVYGRMDGIESAISGYAGGDRDYPSYEQVSSGLTGHAEVVKLTYDPSKIDFGKILDIFFSAHDPTTENRQGADVGSQYRSIILYADESQRRIAEQKVAALNRAKTYANPVVSEIVPLRRFWEAEEYHQDYYERHPYAGYCRVVIAPKLNKLGLSLDALIK